MTRRLRLQRYLQDPGDGRRQPQIPAKALLWSLLIGQVLRACSFLAVERLVRSASRRALAVSRSFSDDALHYFTERLDPSFTRAALVRVLHQAKRNKAFATAPFLHAAGKLGLPVVARLKANLPELSAAAEKQFRSQAPKLTFSYRDDRVELWDAEDFDPWENLRWETVRVLFYRQQKPDGEVIEAFWLTDSSIKEVSSRVLFHRAKSRWEIQNQGFNDAKNRHDLEHICHHHPNSLLITWLLTSMALTIERLYRLRYLRRGTHSPRTAADFVYVLWLSLSPPASADTS